MLFLYKGIILRAFLKFRKKKNFSTEKEDHYVEVLHYINVNTLNLFLNFGLLRILLPDLLYQFVKIIINSALFL